MTFGRRKVGTSYNLCCGGLAQFGSRPDCTDFNRGAFQKINVDSSIYLLSGFIA
jgi:hypothetical protein